jgi:histidine triad (HIT) family protein
LADGEAAGQEVFHVHLHVFPRFQGDGHANCGPCSRPPPDKGAAADTAPLGPSEGGIVWRWAPAPQRGRSARRGKLSAVGVRRQELVWRTSTEWPTSSSQSPTW